MLMMRIPLAGSRDDRGSAVVIALVATVLLAALGQGLVLLTSTEQAIAGNAHAGVETLYAADAAIACVLPELRQAPHWSDVLNGATRSAFVDGTRTPTLPSGDTVDLDALTNALQARSQASDPWGSNNPVWRLYAYGPLDRLAGTMRSRAYVAVWVADDPAETDGDATADSNRVLMMLAEAFGPNRTARSISVTIGAPDREGAGQGRPRVLSWREVR
jgi:hypothetical protein